MEREHKKIWYVFGGHLHVVNSSEPSSAEAIVLLLPFACLWPKRNSLRWQISGFIHKASARRALMNLVALTLSSREQDKCHFVPLPVLLLLYYWNFAFNEWA